LGKHGAQVKFPRVLKDDKYDQWRAFLVGLGYYS